MVDTGGIIDRRRFRRITRFFARVIVQIAWCDVALARVMPRRTRRTRPARFQDIARRFRELATEMGGVMIKAGQFLSSRVDVLPPEITQELAGLQDKVLPDPVDDIRRVIAEELGKSPDQLFAYFEPEPQAAASLGQTHRARLIDAEGGDRVVVKVQRLNIEKIVETDLAALRQVARWVMLFPPIRRRADVPALIKEFSRTTWEELDYVAEAKNAERFQEMFADDPGVMIPAVYHRYSTRCVLTLEDVEQIKITDFLGLEEAKISRSQVARKLMNVYLYQVFEKGFFHADPHPGNLFVRPLSFSTEESRPFQLIFVDFGMVGRLPSSIEEPLRDIVRALALHDARRLIDAFKRLDFFLPGVDLERVEEASAVLLERFWGTSMEEMISLDPAQVQDVIIEFRDLLFQFPFQVPRDFIFLGRAIGILSGLATSLDPQFNPWGPVEKYGQRLLLDERGWAGVGEALKMAGGMLRPLFSLPTHLETFLKQSNRGALKVKIGADRQLERRLAQLEALNRRLYWGMITIALLLSGTLFYVHQDYLLAGFSWGGTVLSLIGSLIAGRRR